MLHNQISSKIKFGKTIIQAFKIYFNKAQVFISGHDPKSYQDIDAKIIKMSKRIPKLENLIRSLQKFDELDIYNTTKLIFDMYNIISYLDELSEYIYKLFSKNLAYETSSLTSSDVEDLSIMHNNLTLVYMNYIDSSIYITEQIRNNFKEEILKKIKNTRVVDINKLIDLMVKYKHSSILYYNILNILKENVKNDDSEVLDNIIQTIKYNLLKNEILIPSKIQNSAQMMQLFGLVPLNKFESLDDLYKKLNINNNVDIQKLGNVLSTNKYVCVVVIINSFMSSRCVYDLWSIISTSQYSIQHCVNEEIIDKYTHITTLDEKTFGTLDIKPPILSINDIDINKVSKKYLIIETLNNSLYRILINKYIDISNKSIYNYEDFLIPENYFINIKNDPILIPSKQILTYNNYLELEILNSFSKPIFTTDDYEKSFPNINIQEKIILENLLYSFELYINEIKNIDQFEKLIKSDKLLEKIMEELTGVLYQIDDTLSEETKTKIATNKEFYNELIFTRLTDLNIIHHQIQTEINDNYHNSKLEDPTIFQIYNEQKIKNILTDKFKEILELTLKSFFQSNRKSNMLERTLNKYLVITKII